ncbi:3555_t:CDS:2, partial [Gigaspora rosea]
HAIDEPTEDQIYDFGLFLIDKILKNSNYSLTMCPPMSLWERNWGLYSGNRIIAEHLAWNREEFHVLVENYISHLNSKQSTAYHIILDSIGNGSNTSQLQNTVSLPEYMKVGPDIHSLIKAVYPNIEQENLS